MWFAQGSKAVIFVFLMYIWYKYGHIKFGEQYEKPEYSTMIYAAVMGSSTLFYAVQEPLFHQLGHFCAHSQAGYRSQDEVDMLAINMAVNNCGIFVGRTTRSWPSACPWPFTALTCRSNFGRATTGYPIPGAYTWGWIGDFMDGLGIIVTVFGSCGYLGATAILLVTGFIHLGIVDEQKQSTVKEVTIQNVTR
jgi:choline/glycine/proline betaine transport protein